MIQQQLDNQPFKFSTINFSNPNSSFHKYVKDEAQTQQMPESRIEVWHRASISTEESQEDSESQKIIKKGKISKTKDKDQPQPQKSETKNIPKNFGVLLKKYLCSKNTDNQAIKAFLKNGEHKKNFSRQDFTRLFNDPVAAELSRQYFSGFQIIHDLMISEKIQDVKNHMKYISKFYNSTYNKQELDELKLQ
ncbi:unnamed protein product (macronuclear) [Paramecium tetraurelia]|uniref:Uncharacterized protein n=1 Tax=Paramecium tetraurelia TaxID=5888 RepID=A0DXL4_PARTE|nr:uncharacterized protein GSPATT00021405001 [Paramecium tetraurelia]CAK87781.1 unnamed protein product [Paramecium tetraurelia]|eukprot:XP_001455178.1 hypothetical protein (macronuclear) [Paramecium tetraurelia strain d4-2]